jgi:ATP-dependent Clp protease ATP-binding subunit ClpA
LETRTGESRYRQAVFERFTELARMVVVFAQDEARALKHNFIGTEHLLLGLLREEEGLAARVLESLDITLEEVRAQVARIIGQSDEFTSGAIPRHAARQEGTRAGAARGAVSGPQRRRHRARPARDRA